MTKKLIEYSDDIVGEITIDFTDTVEDEKRHYAITVDDQRIFMRRQTFQALYELMQAWHTPK